MHDASSMVHSLLHVNYVAFRTVGSEYSNKSQLQLHMLHESISNSIENHAKASVLHACKPHVSQAVN